MEVASTCTEPDCTAAAGYTAGDEATPSTTCPDGCILTEAVGGNAETCLARAYSCRDFDGGELPQFTTSGTCTAGNDYATGAGKTWHAPCTTSCCDVDIRNYYLSDEATGAPDAFTRWRKYDHRHRPWYDSLYN